MIAGVSSAPAAAANTVDPGLRKAAEAFEAVFVRQLIGSMRASSLGDDILGSQATEQFRELADARTAEGMAATGALGIADMLIAQFAKPQEPAK
ncbi:rod-binding protein [Sphingomonas gilva]|nr:rod-binding protein [Sphingomonas gilva]